MAGAVDVEDDIYDVFDDNISELSGDISNMGLDEAGDESMLFGDESLLTNDSLLGVVPGNSSLLPSIEGRKHTEETEGIEESTEGALM